MPRAKKPTVEDKVELTKEAQKLDQPRLWKGTGEESNPPAVDLSWLDKDSIRQIIVDAKIDLNQLRMLLTICALTDTDLWGAVQTYQRVTAEINRIYYNVKS